MRNILKDIYHLPTEYFRKCLSKYFPSSRTHSDILKHTIFDEGTFRHDLNLDIIDSSLSVLSHRRRHHMGKRYKMAIILLSVVMIVGCSSSQPKMERMDFQAAMELKVPEPAVGDRPKILFVAKINNF